MIRYFKRCIMTFIVLMIVTGCMDNVDQGLEQSISLTPVELFEGEDEKYKLFFGTMTGAFKLAYTGEKPDAMLNIDLWEHGEKTSQGALGDLFFSTKEDEQHSEIEIIIEVDTISIGEEQHEYEIVKVGIVHDKGTSLNTFTLKRDPSLELKGKGTMSYAEPQSFNKEESIHVWGVQATSGNHLRTSDLSQEWIEELEWALVFTLNFE